MVRRYMEPAAYLPVARRLAEQVGTAMSCNLATAYK